MEIRFTIEGNHASQDGNPVPYLRLTQNELRLLRIPAWKARITGKRTRVQRYMDWKEYVYLCFLKACQENKVSPEEFFRHISRAQKVRLDCIVHFKDRRHGDPENVRKGISDAIFQDDRKVIGFYDFDYSSKPGVEVKISI